MTPAVEGPPCKTCKCLAHWHHLDDKTGRFPCAAPIYTYDVHVCGCTNYVGELHGAHSDGRDGSV